MLFNEIYIYLYIYAHLPPSMWQVVIDFTRNVHSITLQTNNPYYMEDELLMRNKIDDKQCFDIMVLSWVLMTQILRAALDELGHNGSTRTYMIV